MLCIGIIGEKDRQDALDILLQIYLTNGYFVATIQKDALITTVVLLGKEKQCEECKVYLVAMHAKWLANRLYKGVKFHILIYLGGNLSECHKNVRLSEILEEKNILIVNSDERGNFPFFIGVGTTLITCGMNHKASVTASSRMIEPNFETIQCCIQRAIPTVSGGRLEPQEFRVKVDSQRKNISGVLAAVAASLAVDMEISDLNLCYL